MSDDVPDCLRPLTSEELAKVNPVTAEEIEEALRKGRKEADAIREVNEPK